MDNTEETIQISHTPKIPNMLSIPNGEIQNVNENTDSNINMINITSNYINVDNNTEYDNIIDITKINKKENRRVNFLMKLINKKRHIM